MSKKYIDVVGNGVNAIRVEVYYNLGGINYFTYKTEKRGYYLSVSPVNVSVRDGVKMESCVAFSGIKTLVQEVSRKSKKQEAIAESKAECMVDELISMVCEQNNLQLVNQ